MLPWCLRLCGARIWVVKHLANDWLAGEKKEDGERKSTVEKAWGREGKYITVSDISYDVVSHYIISHNIISYYVILYHITSHCFMRRVMLSMLIIEFIEFQIFYLIIKFVKLWILNSFVQELGSSYGQMEFSPFFPLFCFLVLVIPAIRIRYLCGCQGKGERVG